MNLVRRKQRERERDKEGKEKRERIREGECSGKVKQQMESVKSGKMIFM